jgi:hypothetical protein
MFYSPVARLGGVAILTLSLAACMDISMEVEVLNQTDAKGIMTTTMSADIYQMMTAQEVESEEGFCDEGELIETAETVSCIVTESGPFDELSLGEDESGPTIVAIGGGQVRVSFPLGELSDDISESMGSGEDPEMMAMMASMFEGNAITMKVSGGRIVDTNMDLAGDSQSATFTIAFDALLKGEVELPEEAYAVVQK